MSENLFINKNTNILIVDDIPENLDVLSGMLEKNGFKIRPVTNGKAALKAMRIYPPDIILLDVNMPDMNGYDVCEQLKADDKLKDIPVIFISALSETIDKVRAFAVGGVDYITKPFQYEEVLSRIITQLKLYQMQSELKKYNINLKELVKEQVKEISDSQMATIYALAKLSQSRDDQTGTHLERVKQFCRLLTIYLGKLPKYSRIINNDYVDIISNASALHDIGKVGIPDNILLKPGKLTTDEFEIMKKHTIIGAETLKLAKLSYPKNKFINYGIEIARNHHERWDGTGYPDGLSGDGIPLPAKIMSIADVYDALKSKRPYKEPLTHEESCKIIYNGSNTFFDPDIVNSFRNINKDIKTAMETFA